MKQGAVKPLHGVKRLNAFPVTVHNDSDDVIAWVTVDLTPIWQNEDGKITRIEHEHNDDTHTHHGVTAIGPGGHWITDHLTIVIPDLGPRGAWLWERTITFEDSAGVRWRRVGEAQRLTEWTKCRAEREDEKHLLR